MQGGCSLHTLGRLVGGVLVRLQSVFHFTSDSGCFWASKYHLILILSLLQSFLKKAKSMSFLALLSLVPLLPVPAQNYSTVS